MAACNSSRVRVFRVRGVPGDGQRGEGDLLRFGHPAGRGEGAGPGDGDLGGQGRTGHGADGRQQFGGLFRCESQVRCGHLQGLPDVDAARAGIAGVADDLGRQPTGRLQPLRAGGVQQSAQSRCQVGDQHFLVQVVGEAQQIVVGPHRDPGGDRRLHRAQHRSRRAAGDRGQVDHVGRSSPDGQHLQQVADRLVEQGQLGADRVLHRSRRAGRPPVSSRRRSAAHCRRPGSPGPRAGDPPAAIPRETGCRRSPTADRAGRRSVRYATAGGSGRPGPAGPSARHRLPAHRAEPPAAISWSRTGNGRQASTRVSGRSWVASTSCPSTRSESPSAWCRSSAQSANGPAAHISSTAASTRSPRSGSGGYSGTRPTSAAIRPNGRRRLGSSAVTRNARRTRPARPRSKASALVDLPTPGAPESSTVAPLRSPLRAASRDSRPSTRPDWMRSRVSLTVGTASASHAEDRDRPTAASIGWSPRPALLAHRRRAPADGGSTRLPLMTTVRRDLRSSAENCFTVGHLRGGAQHHLLRPDGLPESWLFAGVPAR